ncbi:rickets, isoform F [Anopheles sinensis]|uniref:Rickets, isoform F n=1 Tax=Anopheles sinensis TaxID=74873 RepID=A0A084WTR9_ANOSI|nr:rickets, isoform F [Anopheles sinensis]
MSPGRSRLPSNTKMPSSHIHPHPHTHTHNARSHHSSPVTRKRLKDFPVRELENLPAAFGNVFRPNQPAHAYGPVGPGRLRAHIHMYV